MPPVVDAQKCTGCGDRDESYCEEICPGNLMFFDLASGNPFCRNPRDCWDCMSCIKACPCNALETKIGDSSSYCGASLKPVMGDGYIIWKCQDIYGNEQVFEYRNRSPAKV